MKRLSGLIVCAILAASCHSNFDRVEVNISGLNPEQGFVADLLTSRVEERVASVHESNNILNVTFLVDDSVSGEDAVVEVNGNEATVKAGRTRGLIYGCGVLLRSMEFTKKGFSVASGEYTFAPKRTYRCCYMARHFNTWYQRAPKEEMLRYIDDMFLWGINTLNTQLFMANVNFAYATPEETVIFDDVTDAICARVKQCDMELQTGGGGNTAPAGYPLKFKATPLDPPRGDDSWNICPSKPGALDFLLQRREAILKRYVERGYPITHMSYFPYDEGGCQCDDCAPWGGNGYVKTFEAMHKLNLKYYPDIKESVSTWCFDKVDDSDFDGLFSYLPKQDWIDYLEVDSVGDFPEYILMHDVPGGIPVTTFPEISMWGRCPWGGYGASPQPKRFEKNFRTVEKVAYGFRLYSEGLYEDINKVVITYLYTQPESTSDDALASYAKYELPGINVKDFQKFIGLLEATHATGPETGRKRMDFNFLVYLRDSDPELLALRRSQAKEALDLALKMDKQIIPSMKNCWRWRLFLLRAIIDNEIFSTGQLHTDVADECYSELVKIYHGEAQLKRLMEQHKDGYTLPPFLPEVQMPSHKGSGF